MDRHNEIRKAAPVRFAAIDPFVEDNIIAPTESKTTAGGNRLIQWGTRNQYPQYLVDLFENVTTLRTIICGDTDFVVGNLVRLNAPLPPLPPEQVNRKGDTVRDIVKDCAHDLDLFGGFALQVIRGKGGDIAELYRIPFQHLRSDEDNEVFFYCENWQKVGSKKVLVYPKFIPLDWATLDEAGKARHAASILYVKNTRTGTYPSPKFAAAVKACELERCIDDYHLNAINNSFEGSIVLNFNNGIPSDEMKEQIEEDVNEKFAGHQNAGRILLSWNPNKDSQTTITSPPVRDFGERYKALAEHSRQQIFTAFRAVPSLFGLPTASGFSTEEYEAAFKLYNRTQIQPMQRTIVEAFEKVLGPSCITIKPFSLDGSAEDNVQ